MHASSNSVYEALSPRICASFEWLVETERRRGLSSSQVAASFACPLCGRFDMAFRSGRYGESEDSK